MLYEIKGKGEIFKQWQEIKSAQIYYGRTGREFSSSDFHGHLQDISVSKDRFFISKGFFSVKDDEVRLYRIMDISLERSFMQRLVGVGTIKVCSGDKTMGDFEIKNIKRPRATKELLSDLVEKQRDIKRVVNRENMIDGHDHSDGQADIDDFDNNDDDAPFDR